MKYYLNIEFNFFIGNEVSFRESCNLLVKGLPKIEGEAIKQFEKRLAYAILISYIRDIPIRDFVLPKFAQLELSLIYNTVSADSFKKYIIQEIDIVMQSVKYINIHGIDFTQISVDIISIQSLEIALQLSLYDSVKVMCTLKPAEEVAR